MSENIFLKEMPATAAFVDVRRFSELASSLSPTELAVALGSFYRHFERAVLDHDGRVVKFISDAALALFPSVGGADHASNALRTALTLVDGAADWSRDNQAHGLPAMTYSIGVASGVVLHGELGTDRLRAFDALGRPVTLATWLARLATARGVANLVAGSTLEAVSGEATPCIEVEGAEFAGAPVRLYRVLAGDEVERVGKAPGKE